MTLSLWARSSRVCAKQAAHILKRNAATAAAPAPEASSFVSERAGLPAFHTLADKITPKSLKAITEHPFKMTTMSSVQAEVLPLLPELARPFDPSEDPALHPARDLLVRAKTGTGKTLGFLVPAIEARVRAIEIAGKKAVIDAGLANDSHLEARARKVFASSTVGTLVISPTRELATQIANEALKLTHHHNDLEVRLFVGGNSKREQMRDWSRGRKDIVVGTPGRLRDLLMSEPDVTRGLGTTQLLILDEADTLLDMGFRDDIEAIKKYLPKLPQRQTFLFSATVSTAIQQVARSTLATNHKYIDCVRSDDSPVHAHVSQYSTILPSAEDQIPHILRLIAHDQLSNPGKSKAILFLPTTKMTQLFATILREVSRSTLPAGRQTRVYEIHSKRVQESRTSTSNAFRADKSGASILVTSDVSARGVDYPGVTRVIQLGIPGGTEQYIHRVGRTGRAGTAGRGDIVLLPWEIGFVTWQLTHVPLKPLTTSELTAEVATLSQNDKSGCFGQDVSAIVGGIQDRVKDFTNMLDSEAVGETFASLLGYYIGKSPELRVQKDVIVEGCKDWATGAMGLPHPPHVSMAFLQKLGYSDGRTKRFGSSRPPSSGFGRDEKAPSWGGRGRQSTRDPSSRAAPWGNTERGFNNSREPRGEYQSDRYQTGRSSFGSSGAWGGGGGGGGGFSRGGSSGSGGRGGGRSSF